MLRRGFISLLAGALVTGSRVAIAQTPSKVYRVGTLLPGPPVDGKSPLGTILLKKLEQHGYTLGKNLTFEARGAGGQMGKLGEIIRAMKLTGSMCLWLAAFRPRSPARSRMFLRWFFLEPAILSRRAL